MCDFCKKYDFRRVSVWDGDFPHIVLLQACVNETPPDDERFRFCPVCGRELTESDFREKV